jgi:flagellar operon protein
MDIRHLTGRTQPIAPQRQDTFTPSLPRTNSNGETFAEVLDRASQSGSRVSFSGHALKRLNDRNIELNDQVLQRLDEAIDRADSKGSRESLILDGDKAFVVNVQNRTVITAVDALELRERVFTQIDSTVLTRPNN